MSEDSGTEVAKLRRQLDRALRAKTAAENLLDEKSSQLIRANLELLKLSSRSEEHNQTRAECVEERRTLAELLTKTDHLTGLENRLAWMVDSTRVAALEDQSASVCLIVIDLDRFKRINDNFGQIVGDRVLQIVGKRLRSAAGQSGRIFRLGGDEFGMLREPMGDPVSFAQKLHQAVCAPIMIGAHTLMIEASIGLALPIAGSESLDSLMTYADKAAYRAKSTGGGVVVCDQDLIDKIARSKDLERELKKAVQNDALEPWVQPIVDTQSLKLVGVEMLARWESAAFGMVGPGQFIPIAEEAGFIDQLSLQIIDKTCTHMADHLRDGRLDYLSFNLSPLQLRDSDVAEPILDILNDHRIPSNKIVIEITENILLSNTIDVRTLLDSLSEKGITIVLDDFGVGYSNLRYLHEFPVSRLKIDRSFLTNAASNRASAQIISAINNLAHQLAINVVVEGVETEEHLLLIRNLGCDYIQGFGIAKPMDLGAFDQWLAAGSPSSQLSAGGHAKKMRTVGADT